MKYFIYGLLMLCGYGLNYGLLPNVLPFWISIDIILAIILSTAQSTKDYTAMILGFVIGALADIFIYRTFGLNMLIYGMYGYFYAKFCSRTRNDNFFVCAIAIFVGYLLKDIIYMMVGILDKVIFNYVWILLKFSLLSAALTGIVGFVISLLIYKLHENRHMKVKRELDFLRNYKEKNDWLGNWFE